MLWGDREMRVKIYSTPTCPFCRRAKEFFLENGIEFEDVDVLKDENARDEMAKKSGQMSVPVIEISRQDGSEIVVGFEKEKLKNALGV